MATAAAANESRGDLLSWINDLLQVSVTKVESIGTGAVLCQIMDSIYGDVQMHKVKFNTNQEYEYINNFKILQACFTSHGIEKFIPVDRLIKLKFQDNLEFLQWIKKFWDANYPGGKYDALSRRKSPPTLTSTTTTAATTFRSNVRHPTADVPIGGLAGTNIIDHEPSSVAHSSIRTAPHQANSSTNTFLPTTVAPPTPSTQGQLQHQHTILQKTVTELRLSLDEIEKERDFYFNKLREIEITTQNVTDPLLLSSSLFKSITEVLYKTEEGFEVPSESQDLLK